MDKINQLQLRGERTWLGRALEPATLLLSFLWFNVYLSVSLFIRSFLISVGSLCGSLWPPTHTKMCLSLLGFQVPVSCAILNNPKQCHAYVIICVTFKLQLKQGLRCYYGWSDFRVQCWTVLKGVWCAACDVWCWKTPTECSCVFNYKYGLLLYAATGIDHHAGIVGEDGSSVQCQLAAEVKQTSRALLRLRLRARGPLRVLLSDPENLTFWVATVRFTYQDTICVLGNLLRDGAYNWFIVFGCKEQTKNVDDPCYNSSDYLSQWKWK